MVSKEDRKRKIINKRPLVLPDEVNGVTYRSISKKKTERIRLLKDELRRYIGNPLYCPALKKHVYVTDESIAESAWHGQYNKKSTYLVLNLPLTIKHASFLKEEPPEDNKRHRDMKIVKTIILSTPVEGIGFAKLNIGKTNRNNCVQYSLTKMTIERLREE